MSDDAKNKTSRGAEVFAADYLAAKKHIDDAALNMHVLGTLKRILPVGQSDKPLQVLEIGGGIGTMLARLVEREVFAGPVIYILTDNDEMHLTAAKRYLSDWSEKENLTLSWSEELGGHLRTSSADISIICENVDLRQIRKYQSFSGVCDLVLAHGVIDLFDFTKVLPPLFGCLKSRGLIYLSCNFDGETLFLPEHPADQQIMQYYHESMERRNRGASRTGRRLLTYLHAQQKEILAAGSSDWIIHPGRAGYCESEKVFLFAVIDMIEHELAKSTEILPKLSAWGRLRRQQAEDGNLFFLAKHLDILARH